MSIHKKLFWILIFCLPINLGKHFDFDWSFVNGILIDYHIPVLYLTDILLILILILWFLTSFKNIKSSWDFIFILSLLNCIFICFLGLLTTEFFYPSLYALGRIFLYFLGSFYVSCNFRIDEDWETLLKVLTVSTFFLCVLGIFQWLYQGAVFNNYLVFGEQPYSISTRGAAVEEFMGRSVVGVYGLFRHPNIFGGYLGVIGIWILYEAVKKDLSKLKKAWYWLVYSLVVVCMFFTLGWFILLAFLIMSLLIILSTLKRKIFKENPAEVIIKPLLNPYKLLIFLTPLLITISLFMPLVSWPENKSLIRRSDFMTSTYILIKNNPLFGTGLNTNVALIEKHLPLSFDLRFVQPVHNIYLLMANETGILGLIFFLSLITYSVYVSFKNRQYMIFSSLIFILVTGVFDHFWLTIHQTLLLFLLTLTFSLTYNFKE